MVRNNIRFCLDFTFCFYSRSVRRRNPWRHPSIVVKEVLENRSGKGRCVGKRTTKFTFGSTAGSRQNRWPRKDRVCCIRFLRDFSYGTLVGGNCLLFTPYHLFMTSGEWGPVLLTTCVRRDRVSGFFLLQDDWRRHGREIGNEMEGWEVGHKGSYWRVYFINIRLKI